MSMNLAVLTECALSRKHGTGAQLLRILEGVDFSFFHLHLTRAWAGLSECSRSYVVEDPRWTGRGKRVALKVEKALGLNWWNDGQIDPKKFASLVEKNHLQCNVAYVVVADDSQAKRFNSILSHLNVPYIVHVMDIYDDRGFEPAAMPQLAKLFRGAVHNIALSEPIRAEIEKFGCRNVSILPIAQEPTDKIAAPPVESQPINIVTVGKPYTEGTQLLADAWAALKREIPHVRVIYAGQHTQAIPAELRKDLDDRGYISDKEVYESLLAESHIAYLSGPSDLKMFGRFSIPSRTSDFLMAGLPVVAAVAEGSATERFLSPLIPSAARTVANDQQLIDAVKFFATDRVRWTAASAASREFALRHLSADQVRNAVVSALKDAQKTQKD